MQKLQKREGKVIGPNQLRLDLDKHHSYNKKYKQLTTKTLNKGNIIL